MFCANVNAVSNDLIVLKELQRIKNALRVVSSNEEALRFLESPIWFLIVEILRQPLDREEDRAS